MTLKAVYASQTLNIYISGNDLDALIETGKMVVVFHVGKTPILGGGVLVELSPYTINTLKYVLAAERDEIARTKALGSAQNESSTILSIDKDGDNG